MTRLSTSDVAPEALGRWMGDLCEYILKGGTSWSAQVMGRADAGMGVSLSEGDGVTLAKSILPPLTITNFGPPSTRSEKFYICNISEPYALSIDQAAPLTVTPDEVVVMSSRVAHCMSFARPFMARTLVIEEDLMRPLLLQRGRAPLSGRRPAIRAGGMFRSIIDPALGFPDRVIQMNAAKLGASVVELLSIMSGPGEDEISAKASRLRLRFAEAQSYIERYLFDPDLTVGAIARRFGVSVRYIQLAFEREGLSANGYIRRRRLEAAARLLSGAGPPHLSITEIAFRCGFNSSAYFTRRFHSRFGLSPRDYRAAHCGRTSPSTQSASDIDA